MFARLLGYAVTLIMIALVLEGVLRLALPNRFLPSEKVVEFHDELGWAKKRGQAIGRDLGEFDVTYRMNALGLRGPETAYAKPEGTKRILVVGDSFTQGFGVEDEDLFLRILERDLRAAGHRVEVLNGGTEGYSTDQEYVWLLSEGLKYAPDVVVLAPYQNDVLWNVKPAYTDRAKPWFALTDDRLERQTGKLERPADVSWWRRHTTVGNLIDGHRKNQLAPMTSLNGTLVPLEDAVVLADEPFEYREAWKVTGALFREFAKVVKENGAVPIALPIPSAFEIHGGMPVMLSLAETQPEQCDFVRPHERIAELAQQAGFVVVDPTADLAAAASQGERLYFHTDWHWNEAGNDVVAKALETRFLQPDLLGPGTGVVAEHHVAAASADSGPPTWMLVVGGLWALLSIFYWRSYPEENVAMAFVRVGLLIAFVVGVVFGVHALTGLLPASVGRWLFPAIVVLLLGFIVVKIAKRLGAIGELYGTFLRRGHWYMLPLLVVMLSIGMLLVVAASSPFVAPFIYTLF